jgi:hypothetical protein
LDIDVPPDELNGRDTLVAMMLHPAYRIRAWRNEVLCPLNTIGVFLNALQKNVSYDQDNSQ